MRVTKTRLQGFPDGEVFDLSYTAFAERYGKDVIEAESQPVAMATAEQVKQYSALLSAVKVDQKILDKWEDNGGPEDLSADDLEKRIAYLSGLLPKVDK